MLVIRQLSLVISGLLFGGALLASDVSPAAIERITHEVQSPERILRERARQALVPLLKHEDLALRAQAFALYGQWFLPNDPPETRLKFWNAGRERLPNGSLVHQFCSLGLAHELIAQQDLPGAQTLAKDVHMAAAQASPRGIDAVVMLGLITAAAKDHAQSRAALTLAEWIIQQGPDYAVAGYTQRWLAELRREVDLLDPAAEERYWQAAENARGDGRWAAALGGYRTYGERWPAGGHAVAAEWAVGLCLARTGDVAAGTAHWQAFIARDPQGSYRGLAWLGLVDLSLIDALDPVAAEQRLAKGLAWCGSADPAAADVNSALHQLHLRAALLAYVHQDRPAVDRHLAAAEAVPDPLPAPMPDGGLATPMAPAAGAMVEFLKGGGDLVPPSALDRSQAKASLLLVVAAFLDRVDQEALAIAAYQRLLSGEFPASQNQRACALSGMATAYQDRFDVDRQVAAYQRIIKEFPTAPIVPRTMYRMAISMYARQLKNDQARKVLDEILRQFPNDEVAPDARFYRMMTCIWDKRWMEAQADLTALEQRYPAHRYREIIDGTLRDRIQAGLNESIAKPAPRNF